MLLKNRPVTLATTLLALASSTGCGEEPQPPDTSKYVDFTLQVLHTSDQESGLDATDAAPRFSAVLRKLEQELPRRT
ncbi:MAG TPA: hypothetical protein VLQ93_01340, partial [Myxococcaceae bacterium]|nr:hypothetical protein [Myxococcaceae bacterium]